MAHEERLPRATLPRSVARIKSVLELLSPTGGDVVRLAMRTFLRRSYPDLSVWIALSSRYLCPGD